jgi:hypothetical protein
VANECRADSDSRNIANAIYNSAGNACSLYDIINYNVNIKLMPVHLLFYIIYFGDQ